MGKIIISERQFMLLQSNINNKIIIREDITDQECINQLTDGDGLKYKVIHPDSLQYINTEKVDKCKEKEKIKCAFDFLGDYNIDDTRIKSNYVSGQGCYVLVNGKRVASAPNQKKHYITFWANGDIVYTTTLKLKLKVGNDTIFKIMYLGKFDCSSNTYKNLTFEGIVSEKNKKLKDDIYLRDSSGTIITNAKCGGQCRTSDILEMNDITKNGQLIDLLNKTTES